MDFRHKSQLYKRFKEHKRRVGVAKRSLQLAEHYYFHHQDDYIGYTKRIGRARLTLSKAIASFSADARKIVSSRIRILWDGDACCTISHKTKDMLDTDIIVLGKPADNSLAATMKHQQRKQALAAPIKVKLRESEQRIMAVADDYQQCMLDYQRVTLEIQTLRNSMTRHRNAPGGLAALSPNDLAIVMQTRELAKRAHLLSMYIPRKRSKLANARKHRDTLQNKLAVL